MTFDLYLKGWVESYYSEMVNTILKSKICTFLGEVLTQSLTLQTRKQNNTTNTGAVNRKCFPIILYTLLSSFQGDRLMKNKRDFFLILLCPLV